jgi:hypothetical protein
MASVTGAMRKRGMVSDFGKEGDRCAAETLIRAGGVTPLRGDCASDGKIFGLLTGFR